MRIILQQTFGQVTHLLRFAWPWLAVLSALSLLADQGLMTAAKVPDGEREPSVMLLTTMLTIYLTVYLLGSALLSLVAAQGVQRALNRPVAGVWEMISTHMKPLTIETLRAFCWCLIFSLLLIVPGVVRYIRYVFVPYVVLFDREYQLGEVDALDRSMKLSQREGWMIFFLLAIPFAVSIGFQVLGQAMHWTLFTAPIPSIVLQVVLQILNLVTAAVLFNLYLHCQEKRS